jgi:transcriptional regulator with GAF, ATPase, and Fis domain
MRSANKRPQTMTTVAWLRDLTDIDAPLIRVVRDKLWSDLRESEEAPFGILILRSIQPGSMRQIRSLTSHARIIVLLGPDLRPGPETKWSLLATGVADVLEWPGVDHLAAQIVPRIARLAEIEALMTDSPALSGVVGVSAPWLKVLRDAIEIAVFSEAGLLLTGESGTGKEQIARLTHTLDRRPRKKDLVVVDCTTLSRELMGSELFGHERGAFTGAIAAHDGAVALAHRGTLFLDEIGELELSLQAQLLRVIQERTFKRVGGNSWQQADFRLICATNRDLEREVHEGGFRADLYYRIADRTLRLPPLRERREDILPLAAHFWRTAGPSGDDPNFDPALSEHLMTRDYPGNVRDLRRTVMALRGRHAGGTISIGTLPECERPSVDLMESDYQEPSLSPGDPWNDPGFVKAIETAIACGASLREIGRAASSAAIRLALDREEGNLRRAARRLGVTDRALQMRRANGETIAP